MNYTKELWKYFSGMTDLGTGSAGLHEVHQTLLNGLVKAKKFELPEGGTVMEDPKLRGLDLSEPLHFPFDQITLEYLEREDIGLEDANGVTVYQTTKKVICVGCQPQLVGEVWKGKVVDIMVFAYIPKKHVWFPATTLLIHLDDWNSGRGDSESITLKVLEVDLFAMGKPNNKVVRAHEGPPMVLAQFLNLLACSNVELSRKKGMSKAGKPPLPFNDYWVLTIAQKKAKSGKGFAGHEIIDRRSPREHVRMGHIRKYENGSRIWVNATVVSKGSVGKITKDYKMKKKGSSE